MKAWQSYSEEETKKIGGSFAKELREGDVLALVGELGSGKTCFVQGLARELQVPPFLIVSSPTFVILHEYLGGKFPVYHFDFYRLKTEKELLALSWDDTIEEKGVCVVEWADRFPKVFPKKTKWVHFKILDEEMREIRC